MFSYEIVDKSDNTVDLQSGLGNKVRLIFKLDDQLEVENRILQQLLSAYEKRMNMINEE